MARHFTAQHTSSGYSALKRPHMSGTGKSKGNIKAAIEAERVKAARMARAKG